MKKIIFEIGVPLIFLILIIYGLTFAEEKYEVSIQGKVMELDVMKKMIIVNEKTFIWNQNTLFYGEKGSPTTADKLTLQSLVSIEATRVKSKPSIIKKLYVLPK